MNKRAGSTARMSVCIFSKRRGEPAVALGFPPDEV